MTVKVPKVLDEGLHITKEFFVGMDMDEVEIRREQNFVIVGPKEQAASLPLERRAGYAQRAADEAREAEASGQNRLIKAVERGISGREWLARRADFGQWNAEDIAALSEAVAECRQVDNNEW